MPGLDTNILVRLLVDDDPRQAAKVEALVFASERKREPLFLPLTVTLELEWVLRSRYHFSKDAVLSTLSNLLETREITFQDEASVERALYFYRSQKADFAECLHLGCAMTHGQLPFLTFDRQAARLEGAELVNSWD